MSVAVKFARVPNDILIEIDDQAKQDAWDQFRVVLPVRGGDHYNLVSTELSNPLLHLVWIGVKDQIRLQVKDDLVDEYY